MVGHHGVDAALQLLVALADLVAHPWEPPRGPQRLELLVQVEHQCRSRRATGVAGRRGVQPDDEVRRAAGAEGEVLVAGSADTSSFQVVVVLGVHLPQLRPQQSLEVPLVDHRGPAERRDEGGEPLLRIGLAAKLPQVGQQLLRDAVAGQLVVHLHRGAVALEHRPGAEARVLGMRHHLGQRRGEPLPRHRVGFGDLGGQLGHRTSWFKPAADGTGSMPRGGRFHAPRGIRGGRRHAEVSGLPAPQAGPPRRTPGSCPGSAVPCWRRRPRRSPPRRTAVIASTCVSMSGPHGADLGDHLRGHQLRMACSKCSGDGSTWASSPGQPGVRPQPVGVRRRPRPRSAPRPP